jgi:hypothetical protein
MMGLEERKILDEGTYMIIMINDEFSSNQTKLYLNNNHGYSKEHFDLEDLLLSTFYYKKRKNERIYII